MIYNRKIIKKLLKKNEKSNQKYMSVDMSRYAGMHLHFHTQRHGYGGASYAAAGAGECKG
jgi:hypothetical protein